MMDDLDPELVEKVARAIDPAAWSDDLPIPTRAHTIAFHEKRAKSIAQATATLSAILPDLRAKHYAEALEMAAKMAEDYLTGENFDSRDCDIVLPTAIRALKDAPHG